MELLCHLSKEKRGSFSSSGSKTHGRRLFFRGYVLHVADTVGASTRSALPGWCTCPLAWPSVGYHQLPAASFSGGVPLVNRIHFTQSILEVTSHPEAVERHSPQLLPWGTKACSLLEERGSHVVTSLFQSSLRDQVEGCDPTCPIFSGLSALALKV